MLQPLPRLGSPPPYAPVRSLTVTQQSEETARSPRPAACRSRVAPRGESRRARVPRRGRSHDGGLRIGEHDSRYGFGSYDTVHQDVRRHDVALVFTDVRLRRGAGDISDRPHPVAGTQALVDRDAMRVGLDAHRLEADLADAGTSSGRHEQAVAALLATVVEFEHVVTTLTGAPRSRPRPAGARSRRAAAPTEHHAERPQFARQHVLGGFDNHDPGTEPMGGPAISTPAGPPPSTISRRGTSFMLVTSHVVHTPSSRPAPGSGARTGPTRLRSRRRGRAVTPSTSTTPGPTNRPVPRSSSIPLAASHSPSGVRPLAPHDVTQASASSTSTSADAAAFRATCTASPAAKASSTGCTPSTSTHHRRDRARQWRRGVPPPPAASRSARPAHPPPARSRRSHGWQSWSPAFSDRASIPALTHQCPAA